MSIDVVRAARLYRAGIPIADIAGLLGCSTSGLQLALRRHGIPTRGKPGTRSLRDVSDREIRRLANLNPDNPVVTVAAETGVDYTTAQDRMVGMGLIERHNPEWADWATQYKQGSSLRAIAETAGVSTRTVTRALAALHVERRPRGRPLSTTHSTDPYAAARRKEYHGEPLTFEDRAAITTYNTEHKRRKRHQG